MKTGIFIAGCMIFSGIAQADKVKETNVPKAVTDAFHVQFKEVKEVKWGKEKEGNYEAEFKVNNVETSTTYTPVGKLIETETEIAQTDLPKAVPEYVARYYARYKISEASKIKDEKGVSFYEAQSSKGAKDMDLIFDEQGNFVRK